MGIESYMAKICNDTAVYWAFAQTASDGSQEYDDPVEISCLWKIHRELMADNDGQEFVTKAKVYVLQDISDHGMLYKGTLADLDSGEEANPHTVDEAYEIKRFVKTPSLHLVGQYNRHVML